jgi:ATP-dependent helicase/DNAse subunit B
MMDQIAFTREIRQCKDIMQRLASLTMQFNQKQLSDEFVKKLSNYLTKEDLMEQTQPESSETESTE